MAWLIIDVHWHGKATADHDNGRLTDEDHDTHGDHLHVHLTSSRLRFVT